MKAKRITLLGLLTAIAIVLSFIEGFLDHSFIAPGIKIGLANAITVVLIFNNKNVSALAVGCCRVLLSAVAFGSPVTFLFAFLGFLFSFAVMFLISKIKGVSPFLISVTGGIFHNVGQALAGLIIYGRVMLAYLPLLLLFGCISGAIIGVLCVMLCNNKNITSSLNNLL